MIKSQKQYIAAKNKVKMLQEGLESNFKSNVPKVVKQAFTGQTKELMRELENEIAKFPKCVYHISFTKLYRQNMIHRPSTITQ